MRQTLIRIRLDDLWSMQPVDGVAAAGLGFVVVVVWTLIAAVWLWHEFVHKPRQTVAAGGVRPENPGGDRWISIGYWFGTGAGLLLLGSSLGAKIKFLPVYGYGFMLFAGFFVAGWFAARRAKSVGLSADVVWDAGMWMFFSGILGARLFYLLQYHQRVFQGKQGVDLLLAAINLPDGGLVLYGGVLLSIPVSLYYCRRRHVRPLLLADVLMPSVFVGLAFGRIGCFLNGCCYGDACSLPWAVRFPRGSVPFQSLAERGWLDGNAATSLALHPTQLYMALNAVFLACLTACYFRVRPRNGAVLAVGWLIYPLTRFVMEYLRSDEQWVVMTFRTFLFWGNERAKWETPFTISQWVSIGLFASGLVFFAWWSRQPLTSPTATIPDRSGGQPSLAAG